MIHHQSTQVENIQIPTKACFHQYYQIDKQTHYSVCLQTKVQIVAVKKTSLTMIYQDFQKTFFKNNATLVIMKDKIKNIKVKLK